MRAELEIPLAAHEIIEDGDEVALLREVQSRRPTAVTIPTKRGNSHLRCLVCVDVRRAGDKPAPPRFEAEVQKAGRTKFVP